MVTVGDRVFGGTGTIGHLFLYDPSAGASTDLGVAVTGMTKITSLVAGTDGHVYGAAGSWYDPAHVFSFDPANPWVVTDLGVPVASSTEVAGLVLGADGLLYGGTADSNTLFRYDPAANEFSVVGTIPGVGDITCLAFGPDGKLYGGAYLAGQLWVFDLGTGQGSILGQPVPGEYSIYTLVAGPDARIYGGTGWSKGVLFSYDIAAGTFQIHGAPVWRDTYLYRLLLGSDGQLYGGTGSRRGRLFRFDPLGHPFQASGTATSIGIAPRMTYETYVPATSEVWALALASDGWLYASGWGVGNSAVLARWDTATGGLMELLGNVPGAPAVIHALVEAPNGKIYGGGGRAFSAPIMFSYDPVTGVMGFLFVGLVDDDYVHTLTLCPDGRIYGGTGGSGAGEHGQLFAYDPSSGSFTFFGPALPDETSVQALVCAPDGTLYGGTGPSGHLISFQPPGDVVDLGQPLPGDGAIMSLALGLDGRVYGGTGGLGRLFAYDLAGGVVTDLGRPYAHDAEIHDLAASTDGLVLGVTGGMEGHLFSYDPWSDTLSDLGMVRLGERHVCALAMSADAQTVYLGTGHTYGDLVAYERDYAYGWLSLDFEADTPAGTDLGVDVLDSAGNVLLADAAPGASLLDIPVALAPTLHLRAGLSTTDAALTPALLQWSVTWTEDRLLAVSPPALAFDAPLGGPDPALQTLLVSAAGAGELGWTLSGLPDWLTADPPSGMTPTTVELTASVEGVEAGIHEATLVLSASPDCANCPVEVPVTLTVYDQPVAVADPLSLSFESVEGETEPETALLTLANGGTGVLTWTATVDVGWLTLWPTAGVAPPEATLVVTADPEGLTADVYTGTIRIAGPPDCANCPLDVPATLTIVPREWRIYLPLVQR